MRKLRVTEDWKATYEDPIVLREGEEFWLTDKTDEWNGHLWVWARNAQGKEGWVPDTLARTVGGKAYARNDFSALELTCQKGEILVALKDANGWVLCQTDSGSKGWVPAQNLEEL